MRRSENRPRPALDGTADISAADGRPGRAPNGAPGGHARRLSQPDHSAHRAVPSARPPHPPSHRLGVAVCGPPYRCQSGHRHRLAIHAAPSGTHRPPMPRSGLPWPHARPPLAPPASRVRCGAASHVAPRRPPCATVATATLDTRPTKRRQGATGDGSVVAATPSAAHASLALQCGTKQRGTLPHKAAQSSAVHGQVVVPSDDDNSRRLSGR